MHPIEPRIQAALDAALGVVMTTAGSAVDRLAEQLGQLAAGSGSGTERDQLLAAQFELRRNLPTFHRVFREVLREKAYGTLAAADPAGRRTVASTDWQSLSLVDDRLVEEKMEFDRIAQIIADACEWELREVAAHFASLIRDARSVDDANPVRPLVLGTALYRATEAVTSTGTPRQTLAREVGLAMARAMPDGYRRILRDLQARGVQAVSPTLRTTEGPGTHVSGYMSGYATLHGTVSSRGGVFDPDPDAGVALGGFGRASGGGTGGLSAGSTGGGPVSASPGIAAQADAQLMALLRRLTSLASRPGRLDPEPRQMVPGGSYGAGGGAGASRSGSAGLSAYGQTGMMAVNLIRAHRDELMQASTNRLDHLVIDVVGSLFDQVLSDPRVPPQMARQIARLQLPVLRVAMNDATFFSSRRHPVRRFVNRIASLALAYDDFHEGAGKEFLERVRTLVQDIVEGDFDQIELYGNKLSDLEAFIGQQTQHRVEQTPAAATLEGKESELLVQQRYMMQLHTALEPLSMAPYLRDFLSQVWSQAILRTVRQDGPTAERAQRFRRAARELVMSVQPKGSPLLRKKFLMQLPGLMKDLKEGMALIGWPESAQKDFFGKLLPAHAESLKVAPLSELDYNMMSKQVEGIFNIAVPGRESVSPADSIAETDSVEIERQFTPEEAKQVNLVTESAVDWDGKVDIDLTGTPGEPAADEAEEAEATDDAPLALGLDINLDLAQTDPDEPTKGAKLFEHIRLGFAYQMHLKDQWQKVRLTYVSPGRSFFVFSHGRRHQETISMTARMLARMCETGRMRAVESTYLLERATQRARKQLAALKVATQH